MKKGRHHPTGRAKRRTRPSVLTLRRRSANGVVYVASYGAVPKPKPYQPNADAQNGVSGVNVGDLNSVGWGW